MKITKLGHCALVIEHKGKKIMTDPGSYTVDTQIEVRDLDFILYTHEHQDHFHLESLKEIIKNNPNVKIFANISVGDLLEKENIPYTLVQHKDITMLGDEIVLEGIGEKHALMHSSIPLSDNIGFFVDKRLWYPGDAFTPHDREVEILALPVSGPWMKISEAIDYALQIKPKKVFPVHDGTRWGSSHSLPEKILQDNNIEFIPMVEGDIEDFY